MLHGRALRTVALVSAAVLVAALVYYRSHLGAIFMGGSKSTFIFVGNDIRPPAPAPGAAPALEVAPPPRPVGGP
jgi:hypothetical protein